MKKIGRFAPLLLVLFTTLPLASQEAALQGKGYAAIQARGTVKIGISLHYPPLNFESGRKGVEMEMARELGKFMGVSVKMVPLSITEYLSALEKGEVDLVLAGLSRNLLRARRIWFSEPYITITPGVLAQKRVIPQTKFGDQFEQSPIRTIWDLKRISGFKCAVKKGSTYVELLKSQFSGMQIVIVETNEEGLEAIKSGHAHGFVHDSLYLQYLYRQDASLRNNFELLQGGDKSEELCAGIPFGDTVMKNQVDVFIHEMKRQGLIAEWLEKYNKE